MSLFKFHRLKGRKSIPVIVGIVSIIATSIGVVSDLQYLLMNKLDPIDIPLPNNEDESPTTYS